jgi:hypothetical protein
VFPGYPRRFLNLDGLVGSLGWEGVCSGACNRGARDGIHTPVYYTTGGQRPRVSRHGVVPLGLRSARAKCHREFCSDDVGERGAEQLHSTVVRSTGFVATRRPALKGPLRRYNAVRARPDSQALLARYERSCQL